MAVISFAKEEARIWLAARWACIRFLEDVMATCPSDVPLIGELQQAIALDGLHLDLLEHDVALRAVQAIDRVAEATAQGKELAGMKWKQDLDEEGQRLYQNGIAELLRMVRQERSN